MADKRLGRDAKAAIRAYITDLGKVISQALVTIVGACAENNLIPTALSNNLTDTFSGQTTEQRTGKLIQSIQSSVELFPNNLDTFLCVLIDSQDSELTRTVAANIARKYGHDLPSYNSLIGDHTDIGESVPTTTTGGSAVVSGVKRKKEEEKDENTEADCLWPFSKKSRVDDNDPFYYYPMEAKSGRGIALIINNEYWNDDPDGKKTRIGSKEDAEKLKTTFEALCYDVVLLPDQDCEEMKRALTKLAKGRISKEDHDSFICCILSHGDTSGVEGVDGEHIPVGDLASLVNGNNCSKLIGKPKIFFIQACRGENIPEPLEVDNTAIEDIATVDGGKYKSLPPEADFFFSFSTCQDNVASRSKEKGSAYIQELSAVLNKYASTLSLDEMAMLVHDRVSKEKRTVRQSGKNYPFQQIPEIISRLRGKVYFKKN